ncbi:ferritin [Bacillus manliponensis]|uniref:Ferritin n=1 Tax=Bacillus manliponensis TaxID=574376 RepID=A0A073JU35_9BACI|nr:DUF3298 and DUF4163 domain-containing protein [Bacillus manliponensis]KEK17815.1 ferritin [Bacillus manliponensis]
MKKRIFFMLLLLSCLTIVPNYISASQPSNMTIHINTSTQKGKNPYFEYEISYPQFSGIPDKQFQQKLNHYYKKKTHHFKKKLEKDAKTYYEAAKESDAHFLPYSATVDYKVTLNKAPLLSLYVNYYQYTGGAHGMYEWKAATLDVSQKKLLHLADLFKEDSNYDKIVREEMARQIKQNETMYFPDATDKVMSEKKLKYFLEKDNLVIYFPLYEIAPYASGIPQFPIPYTLLTEELKPEYKNILIDNP